MGVLRRARESHLHDGGARARGGTWPGAVGRAGLSADEQLYRLRKVYGVSTSSVRIVT